ncbi:hypothetical protein MNBD_PLANCTO03-2329, partial [hydrothermal vent metagenome]
MSGQPQSRDTFDSFGIRFESIG